MVSTHFLKKQRLPKPTSDTGIPTTDIEKTKSDIEISTSDLGRGKKRAQKSPTP